jgi:hypothetical protein
MKSLKILVLLASMLTLYTACTQKGCNEEKKCNEENTQKSASFIEGVQVYYFHNARRCVTCVTVEEESKRIVQELYGNTVPFSVYNLDDETVKEKLEELGVNSQTLLIASGDQRIDITSDAFMYARSNPEKLKEIIQSKIDPLL